jgi:hypothetical protein
MVVMVTVAVIVLVGVGRLLHDRRLGGGELQPRVLTPTN